MKTDTNEENRIENMLGQMGEQGWELVSVLGGVGETSLNGKIHGYYFKRPV